MNNLLSTLYPVGSIYIGTQNSCPLATLIAGSQWQVVGTNRALWGGNGSNGCFSTISNIDYDYKEAIRGSYGARIRFNASRYSSIYGKSNTVQPPAYIVNVWRRTA